MRNPRLLAILTVINVALAVWQFVERRAGAAQAAGEAVPVLRGRMLEIVDEHGKVRASIKVQPAEKFERTGKWYPETVMLRLIDAKGRPEVKIGASEQGGGIGLIGETDETQAHLDAEGSDASLRLLDRGGKKTVVRP